HGTVCVVGKIRDLILQLSKSSIYSTKPFQARESGLRTLVLIFSLNPQVLLRPPGPEEFCFHALFLDIFCFLTKYLILHL
ncbi:hypothetical protein OFM35_23355, partial [Escherichia coli]|nr:hypothetical protein [Escherichia coli]